MAGPFNGVMAVDRGEVLLPIISSVWTGDNRISLHSANHRVPDISEITEIINCRHPEIFCVTRTGAQRTRVETEIGGIKVVVDSDALRKTCVADAALQHLGGADGRGVVNVGKLWLALSDGVPHVCVVS